MKCMNCGATVEGDELFCGECGAKIVRVQTCPNCNAEIALGKKFCTKCGTSLESQNDVASHQVEEQEIMATATLQSSQIVEKVLPTIDIVVHDKSEVETCGCCGKKLSTLDLFCPECGTRRVKWVEGEEYPEVEESFALHKEYYWGKAEPRCEYSSYKQYIYILKGNCVFEYDMEEKKGRKFLESDELNSSSNIAANRQGLYVWEKNSEDIIEIKLYDFNGLRKASYQLPEEVNEDSFYLYEDEVIYAYITEKEFKVVVHNIVENTDCIIFDLKDLLKDIASFSKKRFKEEAEEYNFTFSGMGEPQDKLKHLCANQSYILLELEWGRRDKEGNTSSGGTMHICCDRRALPVSEKKIVTSQYWSLLRNSELERDFSYDYIMGYDMLRNKLWFIDHTKKLRERAIEPYLFDENEHYEISWLTNMDNRKMIDRFDYDYTQLYFDGDVVYEPISYYKFYGMDSNGQSGEWNNSGHGGAEMFIVLGDYVYVGLDCINYWSNDIHFFPKEGTLASEDRWITITGQMMDEWIQAEA